MDFARILAITLVLLPCLHAVEQPCSLSFHLLLQPPPLSQPSSLHQSDPAVPLQPFSGPHLFSDQPLLRGNPNGQLPEVVGSAGGLYLASAADSKEVAYLFFTASLHHYYEDAEAGRSLTGTVVLVGSVSAGALSIVGGTGDFALAMGEAKVAMAPAASSTTMAVSLELELLYRTKEQVGSALS